MTQKGEPGTSRWAVVKYHGALATAVTTALGIGISLFADQKWWIVGAGGLAYLIIAASYVYFLVRDLGRQIEVATSSAQSAQGTILGSVEAHSELIASLNRELPGVKERLDKMSSAVGQNAEFVDRGFIGLQRKAIEVEKLPVDVARLRYAVHGHLPSHIRTGPLTEKMAAELYRKWTPERLIGDYAALINERMRAFDDFMGAGGKCWEMYNRQALQHYAAGRTPFDAIVDPVEERLARFERLKQLNQMKNYNLRIFDRSLGASLILRFSDDSVREADELRGALLIDLRLPDSTTVFDESYFGILSYSKPVSLAYLKKMDAIVSGVGKQDSIISDKQALDREIDEWISQINAASRPRV